MPEVFISYNRQDQAHARLFAEGLASEGFDVWWDATLRTGDNWDAITEQSLNEAEAVVVLWSPRSVSSRWVRSEAAVALRNGTLIPLMIEDCLRPVMFELTQSANLIGWRGDRRDRVWRDLVEDIRRHLTQRRGTPASAAPVAIAPLRSASERRQVTVLNAALALEGDVYDLDPEDWDKAVRDLQAKASSLAAPYEPHVISGSSGATLLFGLDQQNERDALHAVQTALALIEQSGEVDLPQGLSARVRCGLDSGPVIASAGASAPAGLALDSAAQLQMLAAPGSVVIGSAVAKVAGGYLRLEQISPRAFRVAGEAETHTRFELSRARGLTRFVGRGEEFELLMQGLEMSAGGTGQVIGIMAEAGTGKSRLCFEFAELCRSHAIPVYTGSADQSGQQAPLLAIMDLARSFFGIVAKDEPANARAKIERRLVAIDTGLTQSAALISDLIGYPVPNAPPVSLDPEARQRQLVGMLRHLIRLDSLDRPTVIIVEDLHWIDEASASVLEQLVEARDGVQNLMLLNYRPEFRVDWMQNSNCRQVSLAPLGDAEIGGLLDDLLGDDPSLGVLAAPIADLSKGNPYFVEEIVHTLVETGKIEGERGKHRLSASYTGLEVPPTVKAVIAARIDRLPPAVRRVLQIAATIGMAFPEPLVAEVAALTGAEMADVLGQLRRNAFIVEQAAFPAAIYAFKHPLTREMAHESLVKDDRRDMHARVAQALERQEPHLIEENAATLAMHWEEAGEAMNAARRHRDAALRVVRTDFQASLRHWEKVRELSRGRLETPEDFAMAFDAYINLLNFNYRAGKPDIAKADAVLAEGDALAAAIGQDQMRLVLALCHSRNLCAAGDATGYAALAERNLEAAFRPGMEDLRALAMVLFLDSLSHTGQDERGLAECRRALELWPDPLPREYWQSGIDPHAFFLFMSGIFLSWAGMLEESMTKFQSAIDLAEQEGTPELTGWALYGMTQCAEWRGDGAAARDYARRLREIAETLGSQLLVLYDSFSHAIAHRMAGDGEAAVRAAQQAVAMTQRTEMQWTGAAQAQLAWCLVVARRLDEAEALARQAIASCSVSGTNQFKAGAHAALAVILDERHGAPARERVAAELDAVDALMDGGSAMILRQYMPGWRARLIDQ
ncbi:putative ATPase [Novosphingobium kunmingense]|uniref:Putative ATPase n=1 Tax=Novosphingobium kunmingense TaxID=1211806 RepID=A0A2N0I296_9SPHN|nr:TIR domain-containing protein [Novosphingobium kunmingense]PKB25270.1 putative ATPase [Novosphingobium kunmingense]